MPVTSYLLSQNYKDCPNNDFNKILISDMDILKQGANLIKL